MLAFLIFGIVKIFWLHRVDSWVVGCLGLLLRFELYSFRGLRRFLSLFFCLEHVLLCRTHLSLPTMSVSGGSKLRRVFFPEQEEQRRLLAENKAKKRAETAAALQAQNKAMKEKLTNQGSRLDRVFSPDVLAEGLKKGEEKIQERQTKALTLEEQYKKQRDSFKSIKGRDVKALSQETEEARAKCALLAREEKERSVRRLLKENKNFFDKVKSTVCKTRRPVSPQQEAETGGPATPETTHATPEKEKRAPAVIAGASLEDRLTAAPTTAVHTPARSVVHPMTMPSASTPLTVHAHPHADFRHHRHVHVHHPPYPAVPAHPHPVQQPAHHMNRAATTSFWGW
uniref:Uncharacterized protein n=1 Tax=Chromera velia CCMP2878 TaxID=1169474 RepID=A0A0G4F3I5_9ALVE|eukprot:Cvel_14812.t1-p1 / transcript=Cvel_14812.t1 / gene=Cvel_14812 / organism=Chromera_velia_CCMP2878 / gene_product=hypothetical protein / transcript_product=hypothetical protein / location=Cvel_scaffold1068:51415-52434(+) / protein_length=340 / sequence_SO=supercontig / SO=protein_coding / is_pseudo=false